MQLSSLAQLLSMESGGSVGRRERRGERRARWRMEVRALFVMGALLLLPVGGLKSGGDGRGGGGGEGGKWRVGKSGE
jgi:hypothetical protein